VDAELRKGEPTIIRAFRLLYAVAPAVLQPLPCLPRSGSIIGGIYGDILIVMKDGDGGEGRPSGTDCQRKNADFDKRGKGFVSGIICGRSQVFGNRTGCRGRTRQASDPSLLRDELSKLRLGQSECSHIIRPLARDLFRMAQDLADRQDCLYRWTATC
jgi:hypothetical protein